MALFVATEATLFGTLIASYFYLRFKHPGWPLGGIEPPKVALPLALTGALVLSAIPTYLASRAASAGRAGAILRWIAIALAVQVGYLAVQIVLFSDDLSKFGPRDNAYGSIYFTLLAAHHLHVLVGILLSGWIAVRVARGLTNYRLIGVRAIAWYWYFVAALGVAVTLTQLSPSL
jgi:heme/copper-type cytochrome/quinol oxidase subunit 3